MKRRQRCATCGETLHATLHRCPPVSIADQLAEELLSGPATSAANKHPSFWKRLFSTPDTPARKAERTWAALGEPLNDDIRTIFALMQYMQHNPLIETTVVPEGLTDARDVIRQADTATLIKWQAECRKRNRAAQLIPLTLSRADVQEATRLSNRLKGYIDDEMAIRPCAWCGRIGLHEFHCPPLMPQPRYDTTPLYAEDDEFTEYDD